MLSFSTGQPHPLAEQPIIFIASISLILGHCNVLIKIVEEYLALITFPLMRDESVDIFFLVRWEKGDAHCVVFRGSFLSVDITVSAVCSVALP